MRLLLAEDDLQLGQATCKGLMQLGYAVDWLTSGGRVAAAVGTFNYDCIILDLGLPEVTGQMCLQALRRAKRAAPVIVVTAQGDKSTKIDVLDLGADDYITKPYDIDEVAARVRAVVRRAATRGPDDPVSMSHGPLTIVPTTQSALLHGEPVTLTNKEFWLLEALVRNRERIVPRRVLEESLYGWDEDRTSNAIEVFIYQLRRKLGAQLILTVRGVGYRLATATELLGVEGGSRGTA
jgi:DNA-binding response OmpR family regulator